MKKKLIGIIICTLLLTTVFPLNAMASDEKIGEEKTSLDICFIFLIGRISDANKSHDYLRFNAKGVFIIEFIYHGVKHFDIQFEIVKGMTKVFIGLEFQGILTERFICGFLV